MIDLCPDFAALKARIDQKTDPDNREWQKARVLQSYPGWQHFVGRLVLSSPWDIRNVLYAFRNDKRFKCEFAPRLKELATMEHAGDLRLHSLTLYTIVRLLRPRVVLETGVASGKSTAMILLALEHNDHGGLVSFDLPNPPGLALPDGALTTTNWRLVGWLIPQYLRYRWRLRLGDSRETLPVWLAEYPAKVDLFFHDSLHTEEHVAFELETITPRLRPGSVVLIDNADMTEPAIDRWLAEHGQEGWRYGNLAGIRWK